MSRLPHAPLLEVIFEIRWDMTSKADVEDFQYLHGDLYSNIKNKYPFRENLAPLDVPFELIKGSPMFRFREQQNGYPLVQIGPGLISLNTIDAKYDWRQFKAESNNILNILNEIYPKYTELNLLPALIYVDFLEYDKDKESSLTFINSNLQLNLADTFITRSEAILQGINLSFSYQIDEKELALNLKNGKLNNEKDGLVLQTKVVGKKEKYNSQNLKDWLESAHKLSSTIFKSLTEGQLYESFK